MPLAEVFLYGVYTFDNGILKQHLRQDLQSCFGKEGGFLSFFMKREKKGRCFFACGSKTVRTKISVGDLFSNAMNQEQGNIKC